MERISKANIEKEAWVLATCSPNHLWRQWRWKNLDGLKSTTSQSCLQTSIPFYWICILHVWLGNSWEFVQTSFFVILTSINLTKENIIEYCGTWIHYYKMWVQFTSPRSLDQRIHCFFTGPRSLQPMNSFKI